MQVYGNDYNIHETGAVHILRISITTRKSAVYGMRLAISPRGLPNYDRGAHTYYTYIDYNKKIYKI